MEQNDTVHNDRERNDVLHSDTNLDKLIPDVYADCQYAECPFIPLY